ncbi:MAG: hypothetical protein HQM09_15175 [Candidatus Riflebacteria bacterium]|nr:hypothetical protein [Candidatus Riflebacteria bacterium]
MARNKRDQRIKLSDEELYELIEMDLTSAETYFSTHIKPYVIARYELLHSNADYYRRLFPKQCEKQAFSTSDIQDAVEWMMPSLIESFFGPDKLVSIVGRTPDDDPKPLEKLIEYQIHVQNRGYDIISQWLRDNLEAGLGVLWADWMRISEMQMVDKQIPEHEFAMLPPEALDKVKGAQNNGDGNITVKVKEPVRTKDQPILRNIMPGAYIWLPEKNMADQLMFEAVKEYVPLDDLTRYEKAGFYRNVDDIDPHRAMVEIGGDVNSSGTLKEIRNAICNYEGEYNRTDGSSSIYGVMPKEGQEGRKMVMRYTVFGFYDVNGDGVLERVRASVCGGVVLSAEIYDEFKETPIKTLHCFPNSYQLWKKAVADFLQATQDLKTALIMQIVANVAYNNDRPVAVASNQPDAIADIEAGKKAIRTKPGQGQNIDEILKYLPENPLASQVWPLMEFLTAGAENKVGVSRQTQGLDGETLAHTTAYGIGKIMGAQQQRLRLLVRNAALSGMVPLFEHLIELDQYYFDEALVARISGEYYKVNPDEIKGELSTSVDSNIGLNNKDSTISALMVVFNQMLPAMMNLGLANPMGIYNTATKIMQQMGFNNPVELIGMTAQDVQAQAQQKAQQQNILAQLPQILAQLMQQAGVDPRQAAAVVQAFTTGLQQQSQPQPGQQTPQGPQASTTPMMQPSTQPGIGGPNG